MTYLEILHWVMALLNAFSPDNVLAVFDAIESIVNTVETLLSKLGVDVGLTQNIEAEPSDEERAVENEIALKLQSGTPENVQGTFDFSRIRKLLKKAKELGLLDAIIAALVSKVPLNFGSLAINSPDCEPTQPADCEPDQPAAVASGVAPPDLNQPK